MSLIAPTANPLLEQTLLGKLQRREQAQGALGELEPVAVRLGLLQHSLRPRFHDPQLVIFAADHGLAVDGIHAAPGRQTDEMVVQVLTGRQPVSVFARQHGLQLSVVDCGVSAQLPPHEHLMPRKIAHGTRNARVGNAMSLEQAHAAIRAGMEIGDSLRGNLLACAGLGVGSHESAALVLSRLADIPLRELMLSGPQMNPELLAHLMIVVQGAQGRHRDVSDAVEVLAAFGGFETGVMVGAMLVAASKRHLIMVDGIAACAALLVASRIAESVTDYCVFCRSQAHQGLNRALGVFEASALLELGLDTLDGTGACLSWPLVNSAAALLTDLADDDGLSQPDGMEAPAIQSLYDPDHATIPGLV
ncbi:MAG: nicotinate-nucleotide--dimethylbenzimidazole phosphoribosyltransferase [Pseudomonadota bacterium]